MLAPWKEIYNKLDSILKSRHITMLTKAPTAKAMIFTVVVYRYESWIIKKADSRRTDAFQLWCWRRLLRAPWTARRSNQSILKETNAEYSLEGLMLKLQYFGQLMQKVNKLQRTLMLGRLRARREGGDRG